MEELKQYAVSITAAAIMCSILSGMISHSSTKKLVRFIFGVFMAAALIRPISGMEIPDLMRLTDTGSTSVHSIIEDAKNMAGTATAEIIKEASEAYILDKAAELNADIRAEVLLSQGDPPIPVGVRLYGEQTPYARRQLQAMLFSDLGIPKEDQQWIGDH